MKKLLKKMCLVTMAASMLLANASCAKKEADGDTLKLVWYCTSSGKDVDHDMLMEEFNKKLKEKYGMELELYPVTNGEYASKMQVLNASHDEYDLCYVNGLSAYYTNITNGAYYDITDLLPKYAPNTYKKLSEDVWKAATYEDRIYAVPNWQIMATSDVITVTKDWLDKTNTSIDDLNNFDDIEKYLEKVVAINPNANKIGYGGFRYRYYGFSNVYSTTNVGMLRTRDFNKDGAPVIVNQYESEEFKEQVTMAYNWVKKGLSYDTYTPDNSAASARGESPFGFQSTYKPGLSEILSEEAGYEIVTKQFSPATLTTDGVMATATAVGANCKNPEKAVEFIEIMNTDKELYNMLSRGLEGVHYKKISDNVIETINTNYGYYDWAFGDVRNSYVLSNQPADIWEQTAEINDTALVSPILGMEIDTTPITSEIADCGTVINQKVSMLVSGLVDPETGIPELIDALKVAGSDRIIAELQRQIDEWWATK